VTVSVQVNDAHPNADLTRVAMEMGVFVDPTKRQHVPSLDQTGGLDRLIEILEEKSSAQAIVDEPPTIASRVRGAFRAAFRVVKAWARRAVSAVRDALKWLASPAVVVAEYYRNRRNAGDYTGRHRTLSTWYGTQRSTASRVKVQRRRTAGRAPADSEPALPEHFVSYLAVVIEAMRGHDDALHPRAGYQFRC
jgi:hypothetical protein